MATRADIDRFLSGDAATAETLARHACRLALRTSAAILRDRDQAGDVAQDVAIDVLRSAGRLRDPAAFDAYVHRITVRHTLRRLTRQRVRRLAEQPLALLPESYEPAAVSDTDHDTVLAARGALTEALAGLKPKQRLALALRYVHDLSDAEIAAALGCRTGTVHALLSRGRAALRRDPQLAAVALELTQGGSK
jgi:RNA polymerase sigma factor (sigma-70 family)